MDDNNLNSLAPDEIDLWTVLKGVWKGRRVIALFAGIGLLAAILFLHTSSFKYTAELRVGPVQASSDGMSSKLGGLSELAPLVGVNIGGGATTQFQLYLEGVKSRDVADSLVKTPKIARTVFGNEWDASTQTWKKPTSTLAPASDVLHHLLGIPITAWHAPDAGRMQQFLESNIVIEQDPKKSLVTIKFSYTDPAFATRFLGILNRAVDEKLRRRALARSSQYIDYLSGNLDTVTNAEHRTAIAQALGEQERIKMMASSNISYAAEAFEPPAASVKPTMPNSPRVLLAGLFLGIVIGAVTVLFRLNFGRRLG